ncbi:MAG TPA: DUF3500 domain-containing protein [Candidatus Angelobacter sp.]|nr:DUF3500 domain-containing protein [Candidatus Angelobacter sp.]
MQPILSVRNTTISLLVFLATIGMLDSVRLEAAASGQTQKIVGAANAFLETLDDTQRGRASFASDDAAQRVRWSNLPISMAERRGLRMGDLKQSQRDAVMKMLATALSRMGYEKVVGIINGDEVLRRESGGGSPAFGKDQFYVSFMGKPSTTEPWMIQFGGHHLALNITIVGRENILTPSLIAVQPARYTLEGKSVRPLGRETDEALELVKSLDESQSKKAILGFQMRDLVLGPGHDGETIEPEGIKASGLTDAQRELLIKLISEWSGIIHETAAAEKMAEIKAHLADTWFAWSGPLEAGKAYFRIQGPTIVIEYAPQRLGGDVTMHLHTMYRDPTDDYGKKFTGK